MRGYQVFGRKSQVLGLGADINWKKSAPIWQDNIISGGKSFSNKGPLNKAVEAVEAAIGMRSTDSQDWSTATELSLESQSVEAVVT